MKERHLTKADAGKRVRITHSDRSFEGVLVWDEGDCTNSIGLKTIQGFRLTADIWFPRSQKGEVLE